MRIDIITLFPNMFKFVLGESIIKRALNSKKVEINIYNLRQFSTDKHKKVDDKPFGGGPGMILKPEPIFKAVQRIKKKMLNKKTEPRVILLTPQGKRLNQKLVNKLSKFRHLILICGHYEGVDERVCEALVTDEISIGDYVLMGGELPAMVLIDSIVRLLPGVLGDKESVKNDSFVESLLEYPQYTRPAIFRRMKVPNVLLSGDHKLIAEWRIKESIKRTAKKRPDLLRKLNKKEGV